MVLREKVVFMSALAAVLCFCSSPAARAIEHQNAGAAQGSSTDSGCPSNRDIDLALGKASALLQASQYQDAAATLEELSDQNCSPRVSLLFAAAKEAGGNTADSERILEQAHAKWPSDTSIATSLAREYLGERQLEKAVQALAHFHATPRTPEQEMEMATIVYMEGHQLASAQKIAAANYGAYPSVHTLLLLANTLQLQGRYPDVNRLLGSKREAYSGSPQFLITLAESEYDAQLYAATRKDIEHAIALAPNSYQAHYIFGNVLAKLNQPDRAIAEYQAAIALDPNQPRTYFQLALVLRAKQDKPGEERALEQALAADNNYAPAHCEIARLLLDENRIPDAVNHLVLATQINPSYEEAYYLLARAYAKLGEKDKSDMAVKQLIAVRKANRPQPEEGAAPPLAAGLTKGHD